MKEYQDYIIWTDRDFQILELNLQYTYDTDTISKIPNKEGQKNWSIIKQNDTETNQLNILKEHLIKDISGATTNGSIMNLLKESNDNTCQIIEQNLKLCIEVGITNEMVNELGNNKETIWNTNSLA